MPKRATQVILSEKGREELVQITKRHQSEQQQVLRARIVLAAAQGTPMSRLRVSWQSTWTQPVCGVIAGSDYKVLTWTRSVS